MAAGILSEPGTEYGPCADPCEHRDCTSTRVMANGPCRFCGKPIGYGIRFYSDDGAARAYVHAACYERSLEEGGS